MSFAIDEVVILIVRIVESENDRYTNLDATVGILLHRQILVDGFAIWFVPMPTGSATNSSSSILDW